MDNKYKRACSEIRTGFGAKDYDFSS